jgi:hypothetical protein
MKFQAWTLLLSFFLWSVGAPIWAPVAFANGVSLNGTLTTTRVNSPTVTTVAPAQTQQNAEQQTKDLNKEGQQKSNMLGMLAIAAGMGMIAGGVAMNASSKCRCAGIPLIIAGGLMVVSGMLGLQAGKKMGQNADTASGLSQGLSNISTAPLKGTKFGDDAGFKVDPSLLRNDKAKSVLADLEKKTGIKPDDFIKGLEDGLTPAEMLGAQKKFGSADQIQALIDKNTANASPLSQGEVMDKLGMTDGDLQGLGDDANAYAVGGGGGGAKKAEAGADLASLLGGGNSAASGDGSVNLANGKLSDDVQNALDKNGITGRTVFDMVRSQYKKKTPMLFGVNQKKPIAPGGDNPFANLSGGGIEL